MQTHVILLVPSLTRICFLVSMREEEDAPFVFTRVFSSLVGQTGDGRTHLNDKYGY